MLGVLRPDINDAQGACPIAEPEVEVQTARGAVDKLFDVTLAELARTARERNLPLRHPVLSVYSGLIRMTFDIDDEVIAIAGNRRCAIPKVLQVRILPTGRAGSSASEILQQSLPA